MKNSFKVTYFFASDWILRKTWFSIIFKNSSIVLDEKSF